MIQTLNSITGLARKHSKPSFDLLTRFRHDSIEQVMVMLPLKHPQKRTSFVVYGFMLTSSRWFTEKRKPQKPKLLSEANRMPQIRFK